MKDNRAELLAERFGVTDLRNVTMAARERTRCNDIGTQVDQGLFRVVRTSYGKKTTVTPLSEWICKARAIEFLNTL